MLLTDATTSTGHPNKPFCHSIFCAHNAVNPESVEAETAKTAKTQAGRSHACRLDKIAAMGGRERGGILSRTPILERDVANHVDVGAVDGSVWDGRRRRWAFSPIPSRTAGVNHAGCAWQTVVRVRSRCLWERRLASCLVEPAAVAGPTAAALVNDSSSVPATGHATFATRLDVVLA